MSTIFSPEVVNLDKYESKRGVRQVCKIFDDSMNEDNFFYAILALPDVEDLAVYQGKRPDIRFYDLERAQRHLDKTADKAGHRWCGRNEAIPAFKQVMREYHRIW